MEKDNILAKGKWEFNKDVSNCFDDMLERSIPDYNTMRDLIMRIVDNKKLFDRKHKFSMLDLGCSNGINLELFIDKYGNKGNYVGVDNSSNMIKNAKLRLQKYDSFNIQLFNEDIRDFNFTQYWGDKCDLITSILTLQFIPIEYRPRILSDIYQSLAVGGMFIIVEKILQPSYIFDKLFVNSYYDIKRCNGYNEEQIQSKRKALEGVLVPNTHEGNMCMLRSAGFMVDTFWKCLNFEGYVCVKRCL